MSSRTAKQPMHSAAWRISLWATLAFACGTMLVFVFLDRFVANDIQRRTDAWLSGEVEVLSDVAEHTPNNALYGRVVSEVAELASREVPNKLPSQGDSNNSVFFLLTSHDGQMKLWVGAGDGAANLRAISQTRIDPNRPTHIDVQGFSTPFRVASIGMDDGSRIYLGLSERDELRVLQSLRMRFTLLWLCVVLLGFAIVFFTSHRMLRRVRDITEAASRIGQSDLKTRVPTSGRNDEIAHLALTLNGMLDRVESTVHQLHTITDSLAHDLRSPLTAIRGQLETSLSVIHDNQEAEPIVSAIEELDRLSDFLNKSLDVAEAKADALRLIPTGIDVEDSLRGMVDLYEPSMSEKGLNISLQSSGPVRITADAGLMHRMIANLFDNELKHLQTGCSVEIRLQSDDESALLILEDDGRGFEPDVKAQLFARRVKGPSSDGHGLGLAFVDAVVRAHGGTITASNRESGGARIVVALPLAIHTKSDVATKEAAATRRWAAAPASSNQRLH